MGIFKGIKDDYEKATARGKEIEAEYKEAITAATGEGAAIVKDVKAVAGRIQEVAETLESQALSEVAKFTSTAAESLTKLSDYAARLEKDIASKSDALTQVKAAIAKLQAVTPAIDEFGIPIASTATPAAA